MTEKKSQESPIWLSTPHLGGNEMKYAEEAFRTDRAAQIGNVAGFEEGLQNFLGEGVFAAALSSGTAGLHLALLMLGVAQGDVVICQSFTFVASANPITYLGAEPVFVDSERETWNLCPQAVEDAIKSCIKIGKKPKAIIAVCLYGMPYKVDDIRRLSEKYGIPIIEDSAEALGSSYKGQKCGTFGDISILSFNDNKIITTSGGGALLSRNKKFRDRAVFLATQAKDAAPHYEHSTVGYNYRMGGVSAGIGRAQMEVLEKRISQRRENHFFYQKLFEDAKFFKVFTESSDDFFSNHWLSALTGKENPTGLTAKDLRQALKEHNIESRLLWKPMHLQPVFRNAKYIGGSVAEGLFKTGLCLPSGSNLTQEEKERIAMVVKNVIQ